jgi:hypothetical protein
MASRTVSKALIVITAAPLFLRTVLIIIGNPYCVVARETHSANNLFRFFLQKFNYVGAVLWFSEVVEHVHARNEGLGIGQPPIEAILVPDDAWPFESTGILVSRLGSCDAAENTLVPRTHAILLNWMALLASLVQYFTMSGVAGSEGDVAAHYRGCHSGGADCHW